MKLRYLGHSSFELVLGDGRKVIFDPYEAGSYDGAVGFAPIGEDYDLAVVSHAHPDHRCERVLDAAGAVVDSPGEHDLGGIRVMSYETSHDESDGAERGKNLVSIVEAEGVRVAHLGDLGHAIKSDDIPGLSGVDVLLLPVGGFFTIDAETAAAVTREIAPAIAVPMHFKTPKLGFPIAPVDDYVSAMGGADSTGASELEITGGGGGGEPRVVVLDPAM